MKFVVGDIHGEATKLTDLLNFLYQVDASAQLIFIGDYLDKGEDSKAVLNILVDLANRSKDHLFLRGNHEYMWERAARHDDSAIDYLVKYGGATTAVDFGVDDIWVAAKQILMEGSPLFERLVNYAMVEGNFISHSGIERKYSKGNLVNIPSTAFLFNRYDFIKSTGLYFECKQSIFGHTAFFFPYRDRFKIGIDTAATYLRAQPLTAYCLTNDTFYSSSGETYRIPKSVDVCPVIIRTVPYRSTK